MTDTARVVVTRDAHKRDLCRSGAAITIAPEKRTWINKSARGLIYPAEEPACGLHVVRKRTEALVFAHGEIAESRCQRFRYAMRGAVAVDGQRERKQRP